MFYNFSNAIVRFPGKSSVNGLSKADLKPNLNLLRIQHRLYVDVLSNLGLKIYSLDALEEFPDSIFVEDPALTFKNGAILLKPGVKSRMGEEDFLKPQLLNIFENVLELRNGTAEGGDVLKLHNELIIGLSDRTNKLGAEELQRLVLKLGYKSRIVKTPPGVLHLKSDCSALDEETIFATPQIEKSKIFKNYKVIITPRDEHAAANLVRINDKILVSEGYQKTAELLSKNYEVETVNVSQVSKVDAGLSCMSLRW